MAMFSKLGNYKNMGLLIIRVGLGMVFIWYGFPKLTGGIKVWEQLGGATKHTGIHFFPLLWGLSYAIIETFGGFLLIIGLAFRPICLLLTVMFILIAASKFGSGGGFAAASHAIEDAVMFAGLLFIGPGKFSVDKK
jgi:putative oxidoreductase